MSDKVITLMENMKVGTFSIYNEGVYNRNIRWFRIVPANEVTVAMCKSAGIAPTNATVTEEVKKAEPVKAPDVPEAPVETEVVGPEFTLPDGIGEWSEETLRDYAQERDIATHPAARKPGLIAAITRYHREILKQEAGVE
jgi:hypothetical protein